MKKMEKELAFHDDDDVNDTPCRDGSHRCTRQQSESVVSRGRQIFLTKFAVRKKEIPNPTDIFSDNCLDVIKLPFTIFPSSVNLTTVGCI